jgi:hypothetical protein
LNSIKYILYIFLIFILSSTFVQAQVLGRKISDTKRDSTPVSYDSINLNTVIDSLRDTSRIASSIDPTLGVKLSKDAITKEIEYSARDSNWTNVTNNTIKLFGVAKIKYEDSDVTGDSMVIDFDKSIASSYVDKSKYRNPESLPQFISGDKTASYERVIFNMKTKKAIVKEIRTQEGEFFLVGSKTKFVGAQNDTLFGEDKLFNVNSLISTCNHPQPHFGVRAWKLKMIPNKIAVLGPSVVEIYGIPTPLVLPFGFFPLIKGQSSGLIFPSSYDYNAELGFGLREIGYYFPINDFIDMRVTGDIYTRGTHAIRVNSNYFKRYKYNANLALGYNNNIREVEGIRETSPSFSISFSLGQDSKAHPFRQFGGNLNFTTNLYNARTFNNAANVLNNTTRSSLNYNYRWPDSPFKFSMGLDHNQNTLTREFNLTLPTANLTMNSINPFKRKNAEGDERWYERIVVGYGASMRNFVQATDTTIFSARILENLQSGFEHRADISTNFRILKYINVSPSASFNQIHFIRQLEKNLKDTLVIDSTLIGSNALGERVYRQDTTFGLEEERYITKYGMYNNATVSMSANTQLFYTQQFKKGLIRGFRHVMKPSVSLNYSPNTLGRYQKFVDTDLRPEFNRPEGYNPFIGGAYSASLGQENFGVAFSINHIFEGKYQLKKDTVAKKFKLFENMYWNGSYNFKAKSMKWSDFTVDGTTSILRGLSQFTFRSIFTPYVLGKQNQRLNQYLASVQKMPIQLAEFNGSFNTGLSFSQIRKIFQGKPKEENTDQGQNPQQARPVNRPQNRTQSQGILDLFSDFRINHNFTFSVRKVDGRDTLTFDVHSIQLYGSLNLTENWRLDLGNISYDLKAKKFVYPTLSFTRDLHCWNMRFSWYPDRGVYSFFIGVKSGAFNFLKYDYNQRSSDALFRPF